VSTATAVNIAATESLGPVAKFRSWFVFGGGKSKIKGTHVIVGAGESPFAIAFYSQSVLPPHIKCKSPKCI
jgi:hypothetical protein